MGAGARQLPGTGNILLGPWVLQGGGSPSLPARLPGPRGCMLPLLCFASHVIVDLSWTLECSLVSPRLAPLCLALSK